MLCRTRHTTFNTQAKKQEDELKKKEAARLRRCEELQKMLELSGHGKNLTRIAIEEKMSSLRGDEDARDEFEDYIKRARLQRRLGDRWLPAAATGHRAPSSHAQGAYAIAAGCSGRG